jgi:hypothetical protein
MDVHGAGAQRSDPKDGDPANWPYGNGPQGDVIRIFNFVRLVRDASGTSGVGELIKQHTEIEIYPNPVDLKLNVVLPTDITGDETLMIYNSTGQLICKNKVQTKSDLSIDVNGLKPGFYLLKLVSHDEIMVSWFIKEQ